MDGNIISLRDYIEKRRELNGVNIKTFCLLMKRVSEKIEQDKRNLIKINIDDIKIDITTGDVVLSDSLFGNGDMDKTISGFNTGISLMADRKSSQEHKTVAFALMVLGWYYNEDKSSITNDLAVLENFDLYMSKVPEWLHDYFINIFKKMDYSTSFNKYYEKNFRQKIKDDIYAEFASYNLSEEQMQRLCKIIAKNTNKLIKEGVKNA